jgi:putative transposase
VSSYIEEHRERFGVEPICRTLEVSASAYYERAKGERSARAIEDERLLARIREIHERNYCAYGYRGMWIALRREGEEVGRGRVQRLMREAEIQGTSPGSTTTACTNPWATSLPWSSRANTLPRRPNRAIDQEKRKPPITVSVKPGPAHVELSMQWRVCQIAPMAWCRFYALPRGSMIWPCGYGRLDG